MSFEEVDAVWDLCHVARERRIGTLKNFLNFILFRPPHRGSPSPPPVAANDVQVSTLQQGRLLCRARTRPQRQGMAQALLQMQTVRQGAGQLDVHRGTSPSFRLPSSSLSLGSNHDFFPHIHFL